jgi:60 kDa SS-A/Ro ribonucleoprotein
MERNSAGGYGFRMDDFACTYRFMILGTEGGSYYVREKQFTQDALKHVAKAVAADPRRVIDMAAQVLREGRAFKADPALFVLALCAAYKADKPADADALAVRQHALGTAITTIRQSTQLFHFMKFVQDMRGWGRSVRNAFANWYISMPESKLAVQVSKYKNRDGVTHQDILRLAHPKWPALAKAKSRDYERAAILQYAVRPKDSIFADEESRVAMLESTGKSYKRTAALKQIAAAEELLHIESTSKKSVKYAVDLITEYELTHEMVSGELKNSPEVWAALAQHMPVTASLRSLAKMTAVGIVTPMSAVERTLIERFNDAEQIARSRVHPMQILIAIRQYEKGAGEKGSLVWKPSARIIEALNDAFPLSFGNVPRTGLRTNVSVDVSGSMWMASHATVNGIDGWMSAEVAASMAFIHVMTESNLVFSTFHNTADFDSTINKRMSLSALREHFARIPRGGTNTAAPFELLLRSGTDVDAVITYTDNQTWSGSRHVVQAHKQLQDKLGHAVKFINCATSAHSTTDTDPGNPNMLELVGFDASAPRAISEFVAGNI